jgi:hypothetical protein
MSSPKAAAKRVRGKVKAHSAARRKVKPRTGVAASTQALNLAAEMERGLASGRLDVVSDEALQRLMAAVCKIYSQQVQGGAQSLPLQPHSVTPTDVMITASALLRAADLQVFELGMWQSWTGR